jgi:hypothetical protein
MRAADPTRCGRRGYTARIRRVSAPALSSLLLLLASAATGEAQQTHSLRGIVLDNENGQPVEGARLEIVGVAARLSDDDGAFAFSDLRAGRHVLRVDAFGFEPDSVVVELPRDTAIEIRLRPQVFELDAVQVGQNRVTISGRITEAATRLGVAATVSARPGTRRTETNRTGRYTLRNVAAADSLIVVVEAFGFLPRDTAVASDAAQNVSVALQPDPVATRMIENQIARLDRRTESIRYPIERYRRADINMAGTVAEMLYYQYEIRSVTCMIVDDRHIRPYLLATYSPAQIAAIEIIDRGGGTRRNEALMVRIYTTSYVQDLVRMNPTLPAVSVARGRSAAFCR